MIDPMLKSMIAGRKLPTRLERHLRCITEGRFEPEIPRTISVHELAEKPWILLSVPRLGEGSWKAFKKAFSEHSEGVPLETFGITLRRVHMRSAIDGALISTEPVWQASGLGDEAHGETRDEALVALLDLLRHAASERIKKAQEAKA